MREEEGESFLGGEDGGQVKPGNTEVMRIDGRLSA